MGVTLVDWEFMTPHGGFMPEGLKREIWQMSCDATTVKQAAQ